MKIGMNLLLWTTDASSESMRPVLTELKTMGFDGVEVPLFDLQPKTFCALAKQLDGLGLHRTAVTVLDANHNPASADPGIRRAAVERVKRAIDCANAVGAKTLVGPLYAALGVFTGRGPTQDEWRWSVDCVRAMSEHADACDVTLALEFLNRFEIYLLNCATDTVRFVNDVGHRRCRMMFDTFHGHIEEKSLGAALRGCSEQLCHIHISENDRGTPGAGQVDWKGVFEALQSLHYDGWLTIEAFGQSVPSLSAATKIWRRTFDDEETLAQTALLFVQTAWRQAQ